MKSKFLTALLSVLISFTLWVYVVTVVNPESEQTYYNIPVVLDGQNLLEERNLMIISDHDFEVNLKLSGNRTDLNKLDRSNITLLANLSQIVEPGTHVLNYTISYPGGIQSGDITPLEKDPQQITLTVVERSKKEIPVKVAYSGTLPQGYTADRQNITLDHTSVTVSGPKDVIEQITEARITVDLTEKNQTINEVYRHTLCGADGQPIEDVSTVTANVSDIRATIIIRKLLDIQLKLDVIPGGGITADMAVITMDRDTLTVSGSESALKGLTQITLGSIDLGKITEDTTMEFEIVLPDGVNNVTGVTTVKVEVDMPEMETRSFAVTKFEPVNVPEGSVVTFQTEQLMVEVRGPGVLLDRLEPEHIVAVVDFSDAQPGSASYAATIEVRDMEGVGAVGESLSVNATVEAETTEEKQEA